MFQLYCYKLDATINNFMITPSETHAQVLEHMQRILPGEEKEVWPHDINGEPLTASDLVFNFDNLVDSERILIVLNGNQKIRLEPELKIVLCLEVDVSEGLPRPFRVRSYMSSECEVLQTTPWCLANILYPHQLPPRSYNTVLISHRDSPVKPARLHLESPLS